MTEHITLHAYLSYRDADAAIDWLESVLDFRNTLRHPDDRGGVAHAELRRDRASFTLFSDHRDEQSGGGWDRDALRGETVGHGVYLVVADEQVEAAHAAAVRAGTPVVWAPHRSEWGSYRCRLLDPEGYEWTLGTYRPGEQDAAAT